MQTKKFMAERPSWLDRPDEIVINKPAPEFSYSDGSKSLFDTVYNSHSDLEDQTHSISQLTVRDISEAYGFSLAYLGDFLVQMGVPCPIDVDSKLANMLNGEAIYTLLQALTSLDPFDSNSSYDSVAVEELAIELDISVKTIIRICDKESFNLPFGIETLLHSDVAEKIRQIQSFEEYEDSNEMDAIEAEFEENNVNFETN
eukprot:gene2491-4847_t